MIDIESLYRSYGPMVFRRCQRLLGDEARAYEAMLATFGAVLRHSVALSSDAPSALLYRVATNECLRAARAEKVQQANDDDDTARLFQQVVDTTPSRPVTFTRALLDKLLQRDVDDPAAVEVYLKIDRMTASEVAALLGVSEPLLQKRATALGAASPTDSGTLPSPLQVEQLALGELRHRTRSTLEARRHDPDVTRALSTIARSNEAVLHDYNPKRIARQIQTRPR
jgi:RNA polymerase sigma-70 factor, ECF subfamily